MLKNLIAKQISNAGAIAPAGVNSGSLTLGNNLFGNLMLSSATNNQFVKKYEIIETTEDLLALSCAWFRLRKSNKLILGISSLTSEELFKSIIDTDREFANVIRDYYSKKLMVLVLKEKKLSHFRQDLNTFLHNDSKKFTENFIPMVYRLPEFYEYDKKFDELKEQFKNKLPELELRNSIKECELFPVYKFTKIVSKRKSNEYWLKDKNSVAYKFSLDPKNPILQLWDKTYSSNVINGTFAIEKTIHDDFHYFTINGITQI